MSDRRAVYLIRLTAKIPESSDAEQLEAKIAALAKDFFWRGHLEFVSADVTLVAADEAMTA